MKKVLFFTENNWAFGSIHHALCKELYKYGIYANLLDWSKTYSREEFQLLIDTYDEFVVNVDAIQHLVNYGVPLERISSVVHAEWDMNLMKYAFNTTHFLQHIRKFGVVSNVLRERSMELQMGRIPDVVSMGVHFNLFYRPHATKLENVGYAGAKEVKNFAGTEIKRGYLVEETIPETNLNLVKHGFYTWMAMPAYYNKVDAIVVSSIEEGAGLPFMEAAAAGRMVMGTSVGYFKDHGGIDRGGVVLPVNDIHFKINLKKQLEYYKSNPDMFEKHCKNIQEYARENYDWSKHILKWVEFLS